MGLSSVPCAGARPIERLARIDDGVVDSESTYRNSSQAVGDGKADVPREVFDAAQARRAEMSNGPLTHFAL